MRYNLVPYTSADYDEYINCQVEAFEKYIIEFFGTLDMKVMEGHLEKLKKGLFKIKVDGKSAGFVYFFEESDKIQVDVFTIYDKFRNCGIGSEIMQNFILIANQKQKPIYLDTFKTNPARRFYERNGFNVVGENQSHFILKYEPKL